jgi:hypothetical protein
MGNIEVGDAVVVLFLASAAAFLFAQVLIWRYRRLVRKRIETEPRGEPLQSGLGSAERMPAPRIVFNSPPPSTESRLSSLIIAHRRDLLWRHAIAASVFAVVATGFRLVLMRSDSVLAALLLFVVFLWPAILAFGVITEGQWCVRRYSVYLIILAIFSAIFSVFSKSSPTYPALTPWMWPFFILALIMIVPTMAMVPVLGRSYRTAGMLLLVVSFLSFSGCRVAMIDGTSLFASFDHWLRILGWEISSPAIEIPTFFFALLLITSLPGFAAVLFLARLHESQSFSETSFTIDMFWLLCSLCLCLDLNLSVRVSILVAFAAFAAYKLTISVAFRRPPPARHLRLLVLRAFAPHDLKRHRKLFRILQARWSFIGPVYLIGAPDLAAETLEPLRLLQFLAHGVGRFFLRDEAALESALGVPDRGPDSDGRFRPIELFCSGLVWRRAVLTLSKESEFVLLDLSSFHGQQGLKE